MKQLSLFLLLTLFGIGCYAKPLPSLSIKAQWQNGILYDTPIAFNVNVFSHITTDSLVIKLSLPEGVLLVDGQKNMTISIERSNPVEQLFSIQIPKNVVGKVKIEASIRHAGSTTFYAAAELPIKKLSIANKISDPIKKENFKRIKQNGEWLRDYQLQ